MFSYWDPPQAGGTPENKVSSKKTGCLYIIAIIMNFNIFTITLLHKNSENVTSYRSNIMQKFTKNHKKRGSLFLTITLANLNRFFYSFYIILIVKKFYMRL